jgi:predicted nuclease of restriction endonuclease-like RecB superfamily
MLPSELLAVWKRKGMIWPRYSKFSEDDLSVANSLISAYSGQVGQKKSKLKEFADELEDKGFEYRFVRGLAFSLDKRSLFKCDDRVNAVELRRKLFETSGELGIPTSQEERKRVVEAAAAELRIATQDADQYLYADLDSELILEKFEMVPAIELLKEYNFSLTQTLLFDSTEARFTTTGNWQNIFHAVKRLGLIYDTERDGSLWVKIDGPSSLFKLTRRYGTSMAKLLPAILANPQWSFEAKVLWRYTNEICSFKLESWKHRFLFKTPQTLEVTYDSSVEREFASRFDGLKSEWLLKREPEPILTGKQVMIPDFSFERDGVKVYMEIVGFWTDDYLLRKIEKLKNADANILVAVDEDLACGKIQSLEKQSQLKVVPFRKHIPLAPIIRFLEEAFKGTRITQLELMRSLPIVFTEPIVNYAEFAHRTGLSPETVKTVLAETPPPEYVIMPTTMVRKDKLEQVARKIEEKANQPDRLPLSAVLKIVEAEGIGDATSVLENLGYKVVWHGIDVEKAEVTKAENTK